MLEMDKEKADIVYLQETHLENEEHKLKKLSNSQVRYSSYNSKRRVAILIKQHVNFKIENCFTDKKGRYGLLVGKIGGMDFSLSNV